MGTSTVTCAATGLHCCCMLLPCPSQPHPTLAARGMEAGNWATMSAAGGKGGVAVDLSHSNAPSRVAPAPTVTPKAACVATARAHCYNQATAHQTAAAREGPQAPFWHASWPSCPASRPRARRRPAGAAAAAAWASPQPAARRLIAWKYIMHTHMIIVRAAWPWRDTPTAITLRLRAVPTSEGCTSSSFSDLSLSQPSSLRVKCRVVIDLMAHYWLSLCWPATDPSGSFRLFFVRVLRAARAIAAPAAQCCLA